MDFLLYVSGAYLKTDGIIMVERSLRITGHLFFFCFFVFAIVFCYERVLFTDSAYQLFKVINYEHFNIESGRFPAILTQVLTLIGVKLHLPIKWLIVSFSVSFVVVYYIAYLLCVYTFRNTAAGLAIVFVLILCIRHGFFHIVTETHQALVYSCLFFAWIMHQNATNFLSNWRQIPNLLVGAVIICLAGFSHPAAYTALLFCVLFFMVEKNTFKSALGYVMLGLVLLLALVKYLTTPTGGYEGQFLGQLSRIEEILKNFSHLFSVEFFRDHYRGMYLSSVILVGITCIHYLFTGQFKKLFFVAVYFAGVLLFILIVFNAPDGQPMMERAFMPLAFYAVIPFLFDFVIKDFRFKTIKLILVVLLLAYSCRNVYRASRTFSERMEYMDKFFAYMDTIKSHKMLIDTKNTSHRIIYVPWAFSIETLMYSTAQDAEDSKTVFVWDRIEELKAPLENDDLFLCVHFGYDWKDTGLNPRYFRLPREVYFVKQDAFLKENADYSRRYFWNFHGLQ